MSNLISEIEAECNLSSLSSNQPTDTPVNRLTKQPAHRQTSYLINRLAAAILLLSHQHQRGIDMIVTVAALKGGVAKTTTALHLAQYFSLVRGEKTVLLDADPTEYAIAYHGLAEPNRGFDFDVFPMAAAMNKVRQYDHVVIDTEARPSDADLANYAKGCDLLVVPTTPAAMPLRGLVELMKILGGAENWRALLTMCQPHPSKQAADAREAMEAAQIPLFKTDIPRAAAFEHASKVGLPVYEWDQRGKKAWESYEALGREIDGIIV